jgi:hypothetical protein
MSSDFIDRFDGPRCCDLVVHVRRRSDLLERRTIAGRVATGPPDPQHASGVVRVW